MTLLVHMRWIIIDGETLIHETDHSEMVGTEVSYLKPQGVQV